jgi:lipoprotein-anchoring transpeptidase ErfK/SrfK
MLHASIRVFLTLLLLTACVGDDATRDGARSGTAVAQAAEASPYGRGDDRIDPAELERMRMDTTWRQFVRLDTVAGADSLANPERWEQITAAAVNDRRTFLPLHGDVSGPSVFKVQILLDRALFSPGVIDGRWGQNTEEAVYWFQKNQDLPATGRVDTTTFQRLVTRGGTQDRLVQNYRLTERDVSGPFVDIPEDIYEKAEMECLCYESLSEKLAETFHVTPEILAQLNPGVTLDSLRAGDRLHAPQIRNPGAQLEGVPERITISDGAHYLNVEDAGGRVLAHFPTTLGADYAPSPTGEFKVTGIARDPTWHYQPDILEDVPNSDRPAMIPAGPNNAVGVVWMQLSKPHYGIHGTSAPETIGYATSHGCVRLTNWDASFLADRISPGILVHFRDVVG